MKERVWKIIWKILIPWLKKRKLKDAIFIESNPDFTDSAKCVFDEMIRRGLNQEYRIIWCLNGEESDKEIAKIKNVSIIKRTQRIHKYVSYLVKVMISSNRFLPKRRPEQYHLGLAHGAALKNCKNHYALPKNVNEVLTFSDYMAKYDAYNFSCEEEKMIPLGYPRNDVLFNETRDLHEIFPDKDFQKVIYWLPTYRQHKNGKTLCSEIPMPIIYNEQIAEIINNCAKKEGVLVVVKPHFQQDLTKIREVQLSNLIFIDNEFLKDKDILNYEMLGSVDALLSDYSSVYYDYLLVDRPIGLCWDDFESYNEMEGFTVDPHEILAGGVKIYDAGGLCEFIHCIAMGKDDMRGIRNQIKNRVHFYVDNQSTKRVVDHIEEILKNHFEK